MIDSNMESIAVKVGSGLSSRDSLPIMLPVRYSGNSDGMYNVYNTFAACVHIHIEHQVEVLHATGQALRSGKRMSPDRPFG